MSWNSSARYFSIIWRSKQMYHHVSKAFDNFMWTKYFIVLLEKKRNEKQKLLPDYIAKYFEILAKAASKIYTYTTSTQRYAYEIIGKKQINWKKHKEHIYHKIAIVILWAKPRCMMAGTPGQNIFQFAQIVRTCCFSFNGSTLSLAFYNTVSQEFLLFCSFAEGFHQGF